MRNEKQDLGPGTRRLVIAERAGLRIHEVPVDWIDDLDSRVDILATALADLRGILRLVTAVANTAANRRITFGIRGRSHAARHQSSA